jgi:hypothetical protein
MLGLTAAHTLLDEDDWSSGDILEDEDEDDENDDDDDDDFSAGDEVRTYPEVIYELDLGPDDSLWNSDARKSGPPIVNPSAQLATLHARSVKEWHKVGHLYAQSVESHDAETDFDWALVELNDTKLVKPNLLVDEKSVPNRLIMLGVREMMIPSEKMGLGQAVEVVSGTCGMRHGHLSQSLSYLKSKRSKAFTKTYSLVLSDGLSEFYFNIKATLTY